MRPTSGPFEAEGLEATIKGYISAQRAFELEQLFKEVKGAISKGAPAAEVAGRLDNLGGMIASDAQILDQGRGRRAGGHPCSCSPCSSSCGKVSKPSLSSARWSPT
ncbi:MAG: hypothetical protein M5U22_21205 [Thermoleophilia bacterium]|nr:hypothetical protein [Thermoleophilia bacterium]